ncbi:MAG: Zn-ribbon domain-containing OB-fold protein [Microthrixaceae bacterium]
MSSSVTRVPVVDYLSLDEGDPHLVGHRCDACGATHLDRHNACPACGGRAFTSTPLPTTGRIESFTVLLRGAPKHIGPFVSVLVRLDDGTYVKANLVGVPPEASAVDTDEPVHLVTYPAGTDDGGTEAVAFGFAYTSDDDRTQDDETQDEENDR